MPDRQEGASKPVVAELNGSPTDNNATLFKQGYDGVLKPKYDAKEYVKGPDQSVPDWDNTTGRHDLRADAHPGRRQDRRRARRQRRPRQRGHRRAQEATSSTARSRSPARTRPSQGLQNILAGDQCMTVYKAIKQEADAAAELAIALAKGEKPAATGQTVKDPDGQPGRPVGAADPEADHQGQRQGRHRRRLRHQGRAVHRRRSPRCAPRPASS